MMIKLNEEQLKRIKDWVQLGIMNGINECPFDYKDSYYVDGLYQNRNISYQHLICLATCYTFFDDIQDVAIFHYCPCGALEYHEVRSKAIDLIRYNDDTCNGKDKSNGY